MSLASSILITISSPSLSECHNGSYTNAINYHLPAVPVCKGGRDANKRLPILLSLYQLWRPVAAAWPRLLRLLFLWRPQMSANAAGRGSVFLLTTGKKPLAREGTMLHRRLMIVLIYLVLLAPLFVACGSAPAASTTTNTHSSTAVSAPVLTDISSPEALKARFNQDAGVPRLILLVSPT